MGVLVFIIAILAELFIIGSFDSMALWSILMFTFSAMFIYCLLAGYAISKLGVGMCALYTFVWGVLLALEPIVTSNTAYGIQYRILVWFGGLSLIFDILGVYTAYLELFECKVKVEGVYRGYTKTGNGTSSAYTPRFSYNVGKIKYMSISKSSYSKRLLKGYSEGDKYTIWISERNPNNFVLKRRLSKGSSLMLCCGILFTLTTIWCIIKAGVKYVLHWYRFKGNTDFLVLCIYQTWKRIV